ncbi:MULTISPECIES: UDP-N-acetylmuramate dehydrogenase [Shewanella]|uniref:UDP-N-acetylenolpyruvoylglucosamine reductase n=2 Tax=Unclassified Bacteria TaxID=49928 RepID=A0AAU6VRA2_UNCXX|nr:MULTISPECIES: UDP-N-acetylmuramate dehydrogenase [Shewanella]MBO2559213.1 UDP-N-acetylmuramate dehydrogenase [Shewanella algae]MCT8983014.1 UDP-N-acetylmuramate dehydrogenase [Shewanella algae]MDE0568986.1 UDP-N-acetylmuramate dehydrogenase [Shewanella sp. K8]MDO8257072.1 UDP-N-acetylmuramate dehydrogenase [Shewanella algae]PBQ25028.1 UDP-N-acetylenolpyruvoylglucosamine reductase [Shewanella algae]
MPTLVHSLKSLNTFGIDCCCRELIRVSSTTELVQACMQHKGDETPMLILGGGSNLLLLEDYQGTVIQIGTKGIDVCEDQEHFYLKVAAGENWHDLVCETLKLGMPGLENMALIPGTVGAAPIQNIGAYGIELCQLCDWVEYLDLQTGALTRLEAADCDFGYRESIFKNELKGKAVITSVGLKLPKAWQPKLSYGPLQSLAEETEVTATMIFERVCQVRQEKLPDPVVLGNAGSFFKNPVVAAADYLKLAERFPDLVGYAQQDGTVKLAAGWLIDKAGLKGFQMGAAAVHDKQALVLVNKGGARGKDVANLAREIIRQVQARFGVELQPEPRIFAATGERSL